MQAKQRPALVLLDTGDGDFVAARVTTQIQQTHFDVVLTDWHSAGLLAPSCVRLHKIATLAKSTATRRLGKLQASDRQRVSAVLATCFSRW